MHDQNCWPAFVNANTGLAYVTIPCNGRPPRTRLVAVPPPSFRQVMMNNTQTRPSTTYSYEEADQTATVLSDQTLAR